MPRWLAICWVIGVVILAPVIMAAGNFFIREYGVPAGRPIAFMIWVILSAVAYFVLWLFVQTFLQKRD